MNGRRSSYCAALIGASAIGIGCAPDGAERDAADRSRSGGSEARSGSTQPPSANREAIRPPTATTSPAAPGAAAPPPTVPPRLMARAEVRPLGDNTVRGIIEFQTSVGADARDAGPVTINVRLMGLDAGPHGMHVHVGTDCTTPGTHLNPLNSPHGAANAGAAARHLGDLGNITDSLLSGDASFVGKVLIVHKGQDDLTTQPDGGAGEPVACGVIEAAEDVLSEADDSDREV
jgi:superoxide dismutase, Cu-Zn family